MAKMKNNAVMYGVTGTFNKQVVLKKRKGQQYISGRPDTTNVIPTDGQTINREHFADAVGLAKTMAADPPTDLPFEIKSNQTLYQAAVSFYRNNVKNERPANRSKKRYTIQMLKERQLTERQIKATMYLQKNGKLSNAICQDLFKISKPTASRLLQELVTTGIIISSGSKGAGAAYRLSEL